MQPIFFPDEKKVLLFDLHDTLVDRQLSFLTALEQYLFDFTVRWDGSDWNPKQAVNMYANEWQKKSAPIRGRLKYDHNRRLTTKIEQKQLYCLRKSLIGSPLEMTDAFVISLLKRVREAVPRYARPFPEVKETLELLSGAYQLAIISNGSQTKLDITLQASGLAHLFPAERIFVPSSIQMRKPHPDMFQKALLAMDISASEAVMIGNSWTNDIFGANRCGLDAIWIQSNKKKMSQRRIGKNKVIFISRCKQLLSLFAI